ncbi:tRNA 2-selenouridine(34) synthase MnmH [Fusobacterium sp.]|uniref:tRNA 2-selenouridine(34) synthase MnmH n=1 Tax=Fusobacterium sp. TaxID=68766 RepID=UPI00262E743D|nr:tRNA 2-selenouridine(34) synthase MnmH [Fusobacterium sp.]
MRTIKYEDLHKLKSYILIDARSPKEFMDSPIPGAVNIPALLDDERVEVGTAYVRESTERAKEIGIEKISKRLPEIFKEINDLSKKYDKLVFYCARGGMRSSSLEAIFYALKYKTLKLEGGYKAYRNYIMDRLPEENKEVKYVVLHGRTGVGKTKILEKLSEKGYSVMDLEKMADHKGSFFGGLCEKKKQSQKRLESEIYEKISDEKTKYVIVESESKRIGDIYLPEEVYSSILNGYHLLVDTSMENRVKIIMEDYASASKEELKSCLDKVGRYISKERYEEYSNLLEEGKLDKLSEILMEKYYDPLYDQSINKYDYEDEIIYKTIDEAADRVAEYLVKKGFVEEKL